MGFEWVSISLLFIFNYIELFNLSKLLQYSLIPHFDEYQIDKLIDITDAYVIN